MTIVVLAWLALGMGLTLAGCLLMGLGVWRGLTRRWPAERGLALGAVGGLLVGAGVAVTIYGFAG